MSETTSDHRRATAERNVEAILAAAESLLDRGAAASISAVAAAAGVSRVTVYAHFPTREALLEAVVARAVGRARAAVEGLGLDEVEPTDALGRLVAAGWEEIDRHRSVAQAASELLDSATLMRAHEALRGPIAALVERGRAEGVFRDDLPAHWLVSTYFALMHACRDDVRAGVLEADDAVGILTATLRGVFTGEG
jgi:TetR/AcrR family transcriptional regulator, mexCD-oprJ operon repressor